jgi:glycosyltransferase involved in cell wall biosynthesis
MDNIQIFVTTHNRPEFILNCVNSILNQTFVDFTLIISDNSTNNLTKGVLENVTDNRFFYIRRESLLSGIDHFNTILSEVSSSYFMIFHDDDIMHPLMIEYLVNAFRKYPNAVAIGANAYLCYDGRGSNEQIFSRHNKDLVLSDISGIARQYLLRKGIVPFSSFMYKMDIAKNVKLNPENGENFCDAAFIMDVSKIGLIVYLIKPLMNYFVSTDNFHVPDVVTNNKKFISYLEENINSEDKYFIVRRYQIKAQYMELRQGLLTRKIKVLSKSYLLSLINLFTNSTLNYFPRLVYLSFLVLFKISTRKIKVN